MNYKKLLDLQKTLDISISKAHKLEDQNVLKERTLALTVEFSEFANELAAFKYWKKNKTINEDNLYEEFADVLHFFFSFYVIVEGRENSNIENVKPANYKDGEIVKASLDLYAHAARICDENSEDDINIDELNRSYSILLSIAKLANMETSKIEEFYIMKNKINHDRIANNY